MPGIWEKLRLIASAVTNGERVVTLGLRDEEVFDTLDKDRHRVMGALRRLRLGIDELERHLPRTDIHAAEKLRQLRGAADTLESYLEGAQRTLLGGFEGS